MDKRVGEKRVELKEILNDAIEGVFHEAHQLIETTGGCITPSQSGKLAEYQNQILNLVMEQVEQNLPVIPLTKDEIMAKFTVKKKFYIDYNDFELMIERVYGITYEITAEEELNNNSRYNFTVGEENKEFGDEAIFQKLRKGEYIGQYNTYIIAKALYIDGYLEAGDYQIEISW
tara:strand:+ start:1072 stop:1593 length:522 start_codon:yes stop_codon:yes gene_type:complete